METRLHAMRLSGFLGLALALLAACRPIEIGLETPTEAAPSVTADFGSTSTAPPSPASATSEITSPPAPTTPAPAASATPALTPSAPPATVAPTATFTPEAPAPTAAGWASSTPPSFTPIAGWYRFVEPRYGLQLQYPGHWQMTSSAPVGFSGADGFFELYATNSQDNTLANACRDVQAAGVFGSAPTVELIFAGGQEACLVLPSGDQAPAERGRAALVARFPQARVTIVPGVAYVFLILYGDDQHIRTFAATLEFLPPDADLEWQGAGVWGDGDPTRCKALRAAAHGLVSAGDCDQLPTAVVAHHPLLVDLVSRLAPFEAWTATEHLRLRGRGLLAGPAWQRAAFNWARWTYAELASGRACAACQTALAWTLDEAGGEVCRQLTVLNFGYAYAETRPCAGGGPLTHREAWLETAEWERLDDWLISRAPAQAGPNYLAAEGQTPLSADELGQVEEFARALYDRINAEP